MTQPVHTSCPSLLEKQTFSQDSMSKDIISVLLVIEEKETVYTFINRGLVTLLIMAVVSLYKLTRKELQEMLSGKQAAK